MPEPNPRDRAADDDELQARLRNELLHAELEDAHGVRESYTADELSADEERRYLERVRDLEAGGPDSYVAPGKLIGRRYVKRAQAEARGGKYAAANALLLEGLLDAGIVTEPPRELSARAYYRFLTEDLFAHTIPPPPPPEPGAQQRHCIGILYEQVVARREREAGGWRG